MQNNESVSISRFKNYINPQQTSHNPIQIYTRQEHQRNQCSSSKKEGKTTEPNRAKTTFKKGGGKAEQKIVQQIIKKKINDVAKKSDINLTCIWNQNATPVKHVTRFSHETNETRRPSKSTMLLTSVCLPTPHNFFFFGFSFKNKINQSTVFKNKISTFSLVQKIETIVLASLHWTLNNV